MKATVLYDFEARAADELTIHANEEITIVSQDIADGWWLARNRLNKEGIVPVSYVELQSLPEPSMPPPPPPKSYFPTYVAMASVPTAAMSGSQPHHAPPNDVYEDDEWDSDHDEPHTPYTPTAPNDSRILRHTSSNDLTTPSQRRPDDTRSVRLSQISDNAKYETIRKGFKRSYVKSGAEDFLLGLESNVKVDASCVEAVVENGPNEELRWQRSSEAYTCAIAKYKKSSKMHGMKSFVAYSLIPSFNRIEVSRRFKQFDWLYKRLTEKFICICIPTLPEKQVSGRFENEFIEERQRQLQCWLDRVVKHPILGHSRVLQHFLTCTDDKKWKQGKREAEKDQLQGMKFFFAVQAPTKQLAWPDELNRSLKLDTFVTEMDKSTKLAADRVSAFNNRQMTVFAREYQSMGDGFKHLSSALEKEPRSEHNSLAQALLHTSSVYTNIGQMFQQQPEKDGEKLLERLVEQNRLVVCMPTLTNMFKGASTTALEAERRKNEERLDPSTAENIREKACYIVEAVQAECSWLLHERNEEINTMMRDYLQQQMDFYANITENLRTTLAYYEKKS